MMTWWYFFASAICGLYFLFFAHALTFMYLSRDRMARYYGLLSFLSFAYCALGIWVSTTEFTITKLLYAQPLFLVLGSSSFLVYFLTLCKYFNWPSTKTQTFIKSVVLTIFITGIGILIYSLITQSVGPFYAESIIPYKNSILQSVFGYWRPDRPMMTILLLSSFIVLFGNLYLLIRLIQEKVKEPLLLLGIVATLVTTLNDNFLGAGLFDNLVPLSSLGFILECFRFQKLALVRYHQKNLQLSQELLLWAKQAETGRVAQQMSHDLKGLIKRMMSHIPKGLESEVLPLKKSTMEILEHYLERSSSSGSFKDSKPILLKEALEFVASVYQQDFKSKNIRFQIQSKEEFHSPLSRQELLVVFSNLIQNSMEALSSLPSSHSLWIQIEIKKLNNKLILLYSDCGLGIAAPHQERLFDTQFTTKPHGLGLGLNIVREVLLQNGGLVRYRPDQAHTTFELSFILS